MASELMGTITCPTPASRPETHTPFHAHQVGANEPKVQR
jgi:hypothetical protein